MKPKKKGQFNQYHIDQDVALSIDTVLLNNDDFISCEGIKDELELMQGRHQQYFIVVKVLACIKNRVTFSFY